MNYSEKLKDPRWQKRRLEIFTRDGWKCRLCGDEKTALHVHHEMYTGEPWEAPDKDLMTLCEDCHAGLAKDIQVIIAARKFTSPIEVRYYILTEREDGRRLLMVRSFDKLMEEWCQDHIYDVHFETVIALMQHPKS